MICIKRVRKFVKKFYFSFTKVKKIPPKKSYNKLYEQKLNKLISYEKLEAQNKIDIFYFDESGFSQTSNIPKLWTPIRTTAMVKTFVTKRINLLGFLSKNGTLKSYIADGKVGSDKIIEEFFKKLGHRPIIDINPKNSQVLKEKIEFQMEISFYTRKR